MQRRLINYHREAEEMQVFLQDSCKKGSWVENGAVGLI